MRDLDKGETFLLFEVIDQYIEQQHHAKNHMMDDPNLDTVDKLLEAMADVDEEISVLDGIKRKLNE